jgi:hypothetical protein
MMLKAFLGGVVVDPPPPGFAATAHKPAPGKARVNPRRTMSVTKALRIALILKNLFITHSSFLILILAYGAFDIKTGFEPNDLFPSLLSLPPLKLLPAFTDKECFSFPNQATPVHTLIMCGSSMISTIVWKTPY